MERVPITLPGYRRLEEELKRLKVVERPAVIKAISEAREHGDLSENAEYHAAKERQSFIEGRVLELEDKISRAEIIDPAKLTDLVKASARKRTVASLPAENHLSVLLKAADAMGPWIQEQAAAAK